MNTHAEQLMAFLQPIVDRAIARSGAGQYSTDRYGPADVASVAWTAALESLAEYGADRRSWPAEGSSELAGLDRSAFFAALNGILRFTEANSRLVSMPAGTMQRLKRRRGISRRTRCLLRRGGRRAGGLTEDALARHGQHHGGAARPMFDAPTADDGGQRAELCAQARQALAWAASTFTGARAAAAAAIISDRLMVSDRRYVTSQARLGQRFGLSAAQVSSIESTLIARARRFVQAAAKGQGCPLRGDRGPDGLPGQGNAREALEAAAAAIAGPAAEAARQIVEGRLLRGRLFRVPLDTIAKATGRSRQAVHQLEQRLVSLALEHLKGANAA